MKVLAICIVLLSSLVGCAETTTVRQPQTPLVAIVKRSPPAQVQLGFLETGPRIPDVGSMNWPTKVGDHFEMVTQPFSPPVTMFSGMCETPQVGGLPTKWYECVVWVSSDTHLMQRRYVNHQSIIRKPVTAK